jgi:hypothetical protein
MNPRHIAMGLALLVTAALALFGDKTPDSGVAEAVERKPAAASAPAPAPAADKKTAKAEPAILRLLPRASLIGDGDEAMGGAGDVFGRRDWTPPPPPPPPMPAAPAGPPPPPPPPVAPPLPFTYLGKAAEGGHWEVFLAIGDKTYVVRDKMVIDGMYRVDAIAPPNLTLTYLPLNQVQQLNIGVLD